MTERHKYWRTWWNNEVYTHCNGKILKKGDIILEGEWEKKEVKAVWHKKSCPLCDDGFAYTADTEVDWKELEKRYKENIERLLGKIKVINYKGTQVSLKVVGVSDIIEANRKLLLKSRDTGLIEIYYIIVYEVVNVKGEIRDKELERFIDKNFNAVRWPQTGWHSGYLKYILPGYEFLREFI